MAGIECADGDGSSGVTTPNSGVRSATAVAIDGHLVPVDPMDDLQCESCQ